MGDSASITEDMLYSRIQSHIDVLGHDFIGDIREPPGIFNSIPPNFQNSWINNPLYNKIKSFIISENASTESNIFYNLEFRIRGTIYNNDHGLKILNAHRPDSGCWEASFTGGAEHPKDTTMHNLLLRETTNELSIKALSFLSVIEYTDTTTTDIRNNQDIFLRLKKGAGGHRLLKEFIPDYKDEKIYDAVCIISFTTDYVLYSPSIYNPHHSFKQTEMFLKVSGFDIDSSEHDVFEWDDLETTRRKAHENSKIGYPSWTKYYENFLDIFPFDDALYMRSSDLKKYILMQKSKRSKI